MEETYRFDDNSRDLVGIGIRGRSTIFEVSLAISRNLSWNPNRIVAVGNSIRELVHVSGFVVARETVFVVLPIDLDVVEMPRFQFLHRGLNRLHAAFLTHSLTGYIGVKASTVPVAMNWFGVKRDHNSELFGNTSQDITRHPKLVADWE